MARTPIHPGEILDEELKELDMSARKLAAKLGVPSNRLSQIIKGKRDISADTALRLARYFGTAPNFWMNLQTAYDLDLASQKDGKYHQAYPPAQITQKSRRRGDCLKRKKSPDQVPVRGAVFLSCDNYGNSPRIFRA